MQRQFYLVYYGHLSQNTSLPDPRRRNRALGSAFYLKNLSLKRIPLIALFAWIMTSSRQANEQVGAQGSYFYVLSSWYLHTFIQAALKSTKHIDTKVMENYPLNSKNVYKS